MVSVMTVKELYETGVRALMGTESPTTDARAILEHLLGIEFGKLVLFFENSADSVSLEYLRCIQERKAHKPLAYIIGKKEFFSREFQISEGVLVPRPETENLVAAVMERLPDQPVAIADLCSGSGCIGITLALETKNPVDLYELSPCAAEISRSNAKKLGAEHIRVFEQDVLSQPLGRMYDVIVSNPPYIPVEDMSLLMPDVIDYEPQMALTDGGDGLLFYHRLASLATSHLCQGGILAAEVGINQHRLVADIFSAVGKPEIISDYFGVERVVLVTKE